VASYTYGTGANLGKLMTMTEGGGYSRKSMTRSLSGDALFEERLRLGAALLVT
jgi:hypothetical protein